MASTTAASTVPASTASAAVASARDILRAVAERRRAAPPPPLDLSVVIPALDEGANIGGVVSAVHRVCRGLGAAYEVLVIDGGSRDGTVEEARRAGAEVHVQSSPGYGAALREAFARTRGTWVATLDSDLSHPPNVLRTLYRNRHRGEILIASRYIKGGNAVMPWLRKTLSVVLNRLFASVLDLPVSDLSSGFRLYRRDVLRAIDTQNADFSFLQEILVRGYCDGYAVHEVPFHYFPRVNGASKARILRFGLSYLRLLFRSWRLRGSVESADYDERAYDSRIPPQRWWQRRRYRIITRWAQRDGDVVDVGCGSSRILEALPGAIGLDLSRRKLRYRRTLGNPLVCASLERLPLPSERFDQVICSQVIEHVPQDERIFGELHRVLRPGGTLILGTPDYGRWEWRLAEWVYGKVMPGGYAEEHITRYTRATLTECLERHGFDVLEHRYVFRGELIVRARKRAAGDRAAREASAREGDAGPPA
jgi:dolichol-phosphate mannosyltransferase